MKEIKVEDEIIYYKEYNPEMTGICAYKEDLDKTIEMMPILKNTDLENTLIDLIIEEENDKV